VCIDASRHRHAAHLAPEVAARLDERPRNSAIFQNALLAVDILKEQIESDYALRQAALDAIPFVPRQNTRHEIEGKEPFRAQPVVVDGERDALKKEGQIGQAPALFELRRRHVSELVVERDAMWLRLPVRGEHFVVESPGRVVVEQRHQSWGKFLCLHGRARRHPASRAGEASDESHEPAAARAD
jgi:hypothetical protein